jgi:hypothetical protein
MQDKSIISNLKPNVSEPLVSLKQKWCQEQTGCHIGSAAWLDRETARVLG